MRKDFEKFFFSKKEINNYWEDKILWQDIILFIVFRQAYDFLIEEVLDWCHHEQMMSKEDKDVILKDVILKGPFGITRPGMEPFWRYLHEFYFYEQDQDDILSILENTLSILENNYQFVNYQVEKSWKSLDEYHTNHEEFNEKNKDLIFQELSEMIRKGMDQLWEGLDPFFQEDNNL